jgi:hypothetical protein
MAEESTPTPYAFASRSEIYRNLAYTRKAWKTKCDCLGISVTFDCGNFYESPVRADPQFWAHDVDMVDRSATPEGEALHLLLALSRADLPADAREAATERYRTLAHEHHWEPIAAAA